MAKLFPQEAPKRYALPWIDCAETSFVFAQARSLVVSGQSFVLSGAPSSGKSHFLAALARTTSQTIKVYQPSETDIAKKEIGDELAVIETFIDTVGFSLPVIELPAPTYERVRGIVENLIQGSELSIVETGVESIVTHFSFDLEKTISLTLRSIQLAKLLREPLDEVLVSECMPQ